MKYAVLRLSPDKNASFSTYSRSSVQALINARRINWSEEIENMHRNLSHSDLQCLLSDMLFPYFNMIMPR